MVSHHVNASQPGNVATTCRTQPLHLSLELSHSGDLTAGPATLDVSPRGTRPLVATAHARRALQAVPTNTVRLSGKQLKTNRLYIGAL
jgi:hypothetical protein